MKVLNKREINKPKKEPLVRVFLRFCVYPRCYINSAGVCEPSSSPRTRFDGLNKTRPRYGSANMQRASTRQRDYLLSLTAAQRHVDNKQNAQDECVSDQRLAIIRAL